MFFFEQSFAPTPDSDNRPLDEVPVNSEEVPSREEEAPEPPQKRRRFETSYTDNDWELPTEMADYISRQILSFLKPSDSKDTCS